MVKLLCKHRDSVQPSMRCKPLPSHVITKNQFDKISFTNVDTKYITHYDYVVFVK